MQLLQLLQRLLATGIAARLAWVLRKRVTARPVAALCEYIDPRSGARYPLSKARWCADGKDSNGQPIPLMLTDLP